MAVIWLERLYDYTTEDLLDIPSTIPDIIFDKFSACLQRIIVF